MRKAINFSDNTFENAHLSQSADFEYHLRTGSNFLINFSTQVSRWVSTPNIRRKNIWKSRKKPRHFYACIRVQKQLDLRSDL